MHSVIVAFCYSPFIDGVAGSTELLCDAEKSSRCTFKHQGSSNTCCTCARPMAVPQGGHRPCANRASTPRCPWTVPPNVGHGTCTSKRTRRPCRPATQTFTGSHMVPLRAVISDVGTCRKHHKQARQPRGTHLDVHLQAQVALLARALGHRHALAPHHALAARRHNLPPCQALSTNLTLILTSSPGSKEHCVSASHHARTARRHRLPPRQQHTGTARFLPSTKQHHTGASTPAMLQLNHIGH